MLKWTSIIVFFFSCHSQKENISPQVKNYLDTIINIAQQHSLYKENVNWQHITDSVYLIAGTAQKTQDVIPAVQYIFHALNDKHGSLVFDNVPYGMVTEHKPPHPKVFSEQFNNGLPQIKTKLFDGQYGYILVPPIFAMGKDSVNKYAQQIQDSVCSLHPGKIKGWIIDLRLNAGGNMYPMIAGIGNLIGEGIVGSFTDARLETQTKWIIKKGDLFFDDSPLTRMVKKCAASKLPRIAVLISEITSSAGEATAIALKGRANTKFFGTKTSGYVTSNNIYSIDKNSLLLLSTYYEADRTGFVYKDFITPDVELTTGDNFHDLTADRKILSALEWLKKN